MVIKSCRIPAKLLTEKHGIGRSKLYYYLFNCWELAPDQIATLTLYKRIDMAGSSLRNYLRNGMLYFYNPVTQEMEHFNLIYHFCGPVSIRGCNIRISLRIAHDDYNIEPVAMVCVKSPNGATCHD